jgi:hypothetical protein
MFFTRQYASTVDEKKTFCKKQKEMEVCRIELQFSACKADVIPLYYTPLMRATPPHVTLNSVR